MKNYFLEKEQKNLEEKRKKWENEHYFKDEFFWRSVRLPEYIRYYVSPLFEKNYSPIF